MSALRGKVYEVLLDRFNYHYTDSTLRRHGLRWVMENRCFTRKGEELRLAFDDGGIPCRVLF